MTREEAERVAARLVTIETFGEDYSIRVAGRPVGGLVSGVDIGDRSRMPGAARNGRENAIAAQRKWRAAIVRMLVEEDNIEATRQVEAAREAWEESQAQLADAKAKLAAVNAGREDVWFWQGDGQDHAESLTCPVVMQASTMRRFELAAEVCELMVQHATAAAWKKFLEWKKGAGDGGAAMKVAGKEEGGL